MKSWVEYLVVGLYFYLAAILQSGAAYRLDVFGARPDFLLLGATLFPLFVSPKSGAVVGFISGALNGWISGVSLASYSIVRSLFGYVGSLFGKSGFTIDLKVAVAVVVIGSIVTQMILFFFAPPADKGAYFRATLGTAVYNGVLAVPLFAIARRFFEPTDD